MNLEKYSKPLLRIAMSLIFLYFGFQQITNTLEWTGFVPNMMLSSGISASKLVIANAILELTLGALLLLGVFVQAVSLILALNLFFIAFSIGMNPLGIRDFGLAVATLTIFFNKSDWLCLEKSKKFIKLFRFYKE